MPDMMSRRTDVHVRHGGFLFGQCLMPNAYLQPCLVLCKICLWFSTVN